MTTNFIQQFANKVRQLHGQNKNLTLSAQEARNLNHEIEMLLAKLVELQVDTKPAGGGGSGAPIEIEISGGKF